MYCSQCTVLLYLRKSAYLSKDTIQPRINVQKITQVKSIVLYSNLQLQNCNYF